MTDEKTAAYYEGVIERCREYGMTDSQAIEFVKSSAAVKIPKKAPSPRTRTNIAAQGRAYRDKLINKLDTGFDKAKNYVKDRPARAAAIGAGAAAAGLVGYNALKKDDKEEQE